MNPFWIWHKAVAGYREAEILALVKTMGVVLLVSGGAGLTIQTRFSSRLDCIIAVLIVLLIKILQLWFSSLLCVSGGGK